MAFFFLSLASLYFDHQECTNQQLYTVTSTVEISWSELMALAVSEILGLL